MVHEATIETEEGCPYKQDEKTRTRASRIPTYLGCTIVPIMRNFSDDGSRYKCTEVGE